MAGTHIGLGIAILCCTFGGGLGGPRLGALSRDNQWKEYKRVFGKNYDGSNSIGEDEKRKEIFKINMEYIEAENAKGSNTYHLGWGPFTDWTSEEFRGLLMHQDPSTMIPPTLSAEQRRPRVSTSDVPSNVNWADQGATTPVKNQGQCGSCWAFSAVEMIESRYWWDNGKLPAPLSVQQLLDCSGSDCSGGWPEYAYTYIARVGALERDDVYPYQAKKADSCLYDCNTALNGGVMNSWWTLVHQNDEEQIKNYVGTYGPLSACGDADDGWKDYTSGIYSGCTGKVDGHCFQLTGYDTNAGYWWIRNSWGPQWGINGYMKLQYGSNVCNVAGHATDVGVISRADTTCSADCDGFSCGCPCGPKYNKCGPHGSNNCYTSNLNSSIRSQSVNSFVV